MRCAKDETHCTGISQRKCDACAISKCPCFPNSTQEGRPTRKRKARVLEADIVQQPPAKSRRRPDYRSKILFPDVEDDSHLPTFYIRRPAMKVQTAPMENPASYKLSEVMMKIGQTFQLAGKASQMAGALIVEVGDALERM
jgi:hypothetical protein